MKGNKDREMEIVAKWDRSIQAGISEILNNPVITDPITVSELAKWLDRERLAVSAEKTRIDLDYK